MKETKSIKSPMRGKDGKLLSAKDREYKLPTKEELKEYTKNDSHLIADILNSYKRRIKMTKNQDTIDYWNSLATITKEIREENIAEKSA